MFHLAVSFHASRLNSTRKLTASSLARSPVQNKNCRLAAFFSSPPSCRSPGGGGRGRVFASHTFKMGSIQWRCIRNTICNTSLSIITSDPREVCGIFKIFRDLALCLYSLFSLDFAVFGTFLDFSQNTFGPCAGVSAPANKQLSRPSAHEAQHMLHSEASDTKQCRTGCLIAVCFPVCSSAM